MVANMPTTVFINSDVLLHTQQSEMRRPGLILSQGQICLNEAQTAGTLFGTGATDENVVRSEYARSTSLALRQVFAVHFKFFLC